MAKNIENEPILDNAPTETMIVLAVSNVENTYLSLSLAGTGILAISTAIKNSSRQEAG